MAGSDVQKVVLAYSGGLDTSVIVPWLRENYDCEVICFTAAAAGALDENTAHGLGGGGEELGAILPAPICVADEAQPSFVNQGGGLHRVPMLLPGNPGPGQTPQLGVEQRQQLVRRVGPAGPDVTEQAGDLRGSVVCHDGKW